jgi:hypothetical protein
VKIQLATDSARFLLTLNADPGKRLALQPSEACRNARNSRVAFGGIIASDYCAAFGRSLSYSARATNRAPQNVAYPA